MTKRNNVLLLLGIICSLVTICINYDEPKTIVEEKPTVYHVDDLQAGTTLRLKNILESANSQASVEATEVDLVAAGLVMEYEDAYVGFKNNEEYNVGYIYKDSVEVKSLPSTDSDVVVTYSRNTKIEYRDCITNSDWSEIKYYDEEYDVDLVAYVLDDNISTTKNISCDYLMSSSRFKNRGVIYYAGHKWTWYSQKVLPGGALNIPGRHVSNGYICDSEGYIVGASRDYAKGTILNSPLGIQVKIYDWCPTHGTIDIYCNY